MVFPIVYLLLLGNALNRPLRGVPLAVVDEAGNSLAAVKPVAGFTWSPWLELGIVALYSAALLAAGGWLLVHRDA